MKDRTIVTDNGELVNQLVQDQKGGVMPTAPKAMKINWFSNSPWAS